MKKNKDDLLNNLIIVKRSGQRVLFNANKIAIAIKRAFDSIDLHDLKDINRVFDDVIKDIQKNYKTRKTINVEDIQDIIENKLKINNHLQVYEAFSLYREKRAESRKAFSTKQQHKFVRAIEKIVKDKDDNKNINSISEFGKTVSTEFTKAYILDSKFIRAHEEGIIYIENLDYLGLGIFDSIHLSLNINNVPEENVFYELINLLLAVKDEISGEVRIDRLDRTLSSYVIKNYMNTLKENICNYLNISGHLNYLNPKKIEEIIDKQNNFIDDFSIFEQFILNNQVKNIFETANKDTLIKVELLLTVGLKNMLLILNNNQAKRKYSISLEESNNLCEKFINETLFKILNELPYLNNIEIIYKLNNLSNNTYLNKITQLIILKKNIQISFFNNNDNIENFNNKEKTVDIAKPLSKEAAGKMLIGLTSINMSRLGFKYHGKKINEFYQELDEILELVKNELLLLFDLVSDKYKEDYKIIFNSEFLEEEKLETKQKIRKIIKNGTLNINIIGLKECLNNIEDNLELHSKLLLDILKHMNKKCLDYSVEYKLNFVLSMIDKPISSKELIDTDKTIYGLIPNITNKDNYELISEITYSNKYIDDLKLIGSCQKLLTGGNICILKFKHKVEEQTLNKIIKIVGECDIGLLKVKIEGVR